MDELFRFNDIIVTPRVVRFGGVSYQVSNISSVVIYDKRKMNTLALFLLVLGVIVGLIAAFFYERNPDYALWAGVAAPAILVLGIIVQNIWPVHEYRLQMKMNSGEVQPLTTVDRAAVYDLKAAIEATFDRPKAA
jgi:multisubunit Na+/H+ antiporter MnhB subunit